MFSYYGSKSKLVKLYQPPKYSLIIEPFAGSARYALQYFERDVLLVDAYEVVIKIWHFLQKASEKDIIGLPNLTYKQTVEDYNLSEEEKLFLGFLVARGVRRPQKIVQKFSCVEQDKAKIAKNLYKIKHWKIRLGNYKDIENTEATWFVDPPYQNIGNISGGANSGKSTYNVNENGNKIDFKLLANWCIERNGQTIVCENTASTWLPFLPLKKQRGQLLTSMEAVWYNN